MIENEHIIEPSKMSKPYGNKSRSASNNHGNRKSSNTRERRENSIKKTQIEILDHETPIEQYQQ